jgi:hypothetical protein
MHRAQRGYGIRTIFPLDAQKRDRGDVVISPRLRHVSMIAIGLRRRIRENNKS